MWSCLTVQGVATPTLLERTESHPLDDRQSVRGRANDDMRRPWRKLPVRRGDDRLATLDEREDESLRAFVGRDDGLRVIPLFRQAADLLFQ